MLQEHLYGLRECERTPVLAFDVHTVNHAPNRVRVDIAAQYRQEFLGGTADLRGAVHDCESPHAAFALSRFFSQRMNERLAWGK